MIRDLLLSAYGTCLLALCIHFVPAKIDSGVAVIQSSRLIPRFACATIAWHVFI